MPDRAQPSLLAGAAIADITPPLDVGILMSAIERRWAPFTDVRMPLQAHALCLQQADRRVVLVALDLLGLAGRAIGGRDWFKRQVLTASHHACRPSELILSCTHTHSAPDTLSGSDLYKTPHFKRWIESLARAIGQAVAHAVADAEPAELAVAKITLPGAGVSVNRRVRTQRGTEILGPHIHPSEIRNPVRPTDEEVTVAAIHTPAGWTKALWVTATCHPVHEMCLRRVSPDYPGEMRQALAERLGPIPILFTNGAAGNINPSSGVSDGPDPAKEHGQALASAVLDRLDRGLDPQPAPLRLIRRRVRLPRRLARTGQPLRVPLHAVVHALRLGRAAWVFFPSEPFVEIALRIKQFSPLSSTTVVGYTGDMIGYLPTRRAFDEGGYELGPGIRARAGRGVDSLLITAADALLTDLAASDPS
ncbi:MAG: hypothetical protein IT442_07375 [Phycisphaeraceae bacterium]|nr:hypothetical protein [Phycisphaeraceae bacterium]